MESIVNNLINAIGWSIFHSLWQAAIIYGVLLLLTATLPGMNAKLKHNLAYGSICLMFIGFVTTFFFIFRLPAHPVQELTDNQHLILVQYVSGWSERLGAQTESLFPYMASIYTAGLLFQLMILIVGYKKLQLLKKTGKALVPQDWENIFVSILSRLKLPQKVSFYLSDKVNVPLVIGYFKPVVLFPVALVAQLDIKQVEAILIHELSHIRRNDYLLNLIKTAIETLMFFNPFVWLSRRLIHIEREHACDDLVLKLTGTPLTYAHALLKLEMIKNKNTPALSMAANGNNQHLYQRIKRITDMKTTYVNAKQQFFAIALTIATVVSLAWINPSENQVTEPTASLNKTAKTAIRPLPSLPSAPARSIYSDTPKKKLKFKIVTIDAKGQKQEYNSVKEMPDSLKKEVINDTFINRDDFKFNFNVDSVVNASLSFMKSPEWKIEMRNKAETLRNSFHANEWRMNAEDIKKNAEKIRQFFDSKQWKNQQKKMIDQQKQIELKLNSPEFKAELDKAKLHAETLKPHFRTPLFREKNEATKTLEGSKEYQELKKKFDEDVEALQKKLQ